MEEIWAEQICSISYILLYMFCNVFSAGMEMAERRALTTDGVLRNYNGFQLCIFLAVRFEEIEGESKKYLCVGRVTDNHSCRWSQYSHVYGFYWCFKKWIADNHYLFCVRYSQSVGAICKFLLRMREGWVT